VLVLLTALGLTLVTGDYTDSAVIGLVVIVNSAMGLRQEIKAERSVRALSALVEPRAWVERSGRAIEVPSTTLVPGDLMLLRQGDLVPADAWLVDGAGLEADESMLTGESVPVPKSPRQDPGPAAGGGLPSCDTDSPSALFSGTVVVHGHGRARVTATGARSTVGRIAGMTGRPGAPTPLQRRMARLSAYLAVGAVLLSAVVLVLGVARGEPLEVMLLATVALVVAAVPESLPLVVTLGLALAARRMAGRRAVVRDLAAVETLGSVTLLATDKTGTLTQGSMSVAATWQPDDAAPSDLTRALALCNDAVLAKASGRPHGDPTDTALLLAAVDRGADVARLRADHPRIREVPFDSTRKAMETIHREPTGASLTLRKGAPEVMLTANAVAEDPAVLAEARELAHRWGRAGKRVLAVTQDHATAGDGNVARPRLLGLVALHDPVRETSRDTVASCRDAGLQVVLITGDHAATAHAIAEEVGILDGPPEEPGDQPADSTVEAADVERRRVIARATPADKHAIVTALQRSGHVVAMTGDGVNDAPALSRADIGIAMGERGTEVARQAADLVLADDNLATLVSAIEEGRRVYDNLRRFLAYGLSGGGSEVLLMLVGPLVGVPLPLLPAQILWLNLLTHSFAGAGLAGQPADSRVLRRGPRAPDEGPLARGLWWRIAVLAVYLAAVSVAAMWVSPASAHSAVLLTLGAGQLAVAWGVRTPGAPVRTRAGHADPLLLALLLAGLMLTAAVTVLPLRELLGTEVVDATAWGVAAAAGIGAFLLTRLTRTSSV
jgi:Ca2+-transporting ATPase